MHTHTHTHTHTCTHAHAQVRHLQRLPKDALLRWYSEACPGTSSMQALFLLGEDAHAHTHMHMHTHTCICPGTSSMQALFLLGEDAGSCLRIIGNEGSRYNHALMGYVLTLTLTLTLTQRGKQVQPCADGHTHTHIHTRIHVYAQVQPRADGLRAAVARACPCGHLFPTSYFPT